MKKNGPKTSKINYNEIENYENVKPIHDIEEDSNQEHNRKNEVETYHPDES